MVFSRTFDATFVLILFSKLLSRMCRNEGDEAFLGSLWQDYQEALGLVCCDFYLVLNFKFEDQLSWSGIE